MERRSGLRMLALLSYAAVAASSSLGTLSPTLLPLLPLPLQQVPLVGESASVPLPHAAFLDEVSRSAEGHFGLLLRTRDAAAVSWTPLLRVERIDRDAGSLHVRCIGRASIARALQPIVRAGGMPAVDCALTEPYCDTPQSEGESKRVDAALEEIEDLHSEFCQRWSRVTVLRGETSSKHVVQGLELAGTELAVRARERAQGLDDELLLGENRAPGGAEQLLATFAAFGRDVATWKTRMAAMQCTDSAARVALAERAVKWTTRRLEAEISLRSVIVTDS